MKLHVMLLCLILLPLPIYCMEYSQFDWQGLPSDIKKKIMYEYVGVEISPMIAKNFKKDGSENVTNDYDYAAWYYTIDQIIVLNGVISACTNCPGKPKLVWQKDTKQKIVSIASSSKGDCLAYADENGMITICDMQTGDSIRVFDSMKDKKKLQDNTSKYSRINGLLFDSNDSRLVAVGSGILLYSLALGNVSLMINSILISVKFDEIAFNKDNADLIDVWLCNTKNYCTRWNSKMMKIENEKIIANRPELPFAARLKIHSKDNDKKSDAFSVVAQAGSRGIIKQWPNYLIKTKKEYAEPKLQFDPLFAHLLLHEITAASTQSAATVLTQKEQLYFNLIDHALHGALTRFRAKLGADA